MKLIILNILICITAYDDGQNYCKQITANNYDDCTNDKISIVDFKWTIDVSFNGQKAVPAQGIEGGGKRIPQKQFGVDVNRALFVLADVNDQHTITLTSNIANCKIVIRRNDMTFVYFETTTTILTVSETIKPNEHALFAVTNPDCVFYVEITNQPKRLHHVFLRDIETQSLSKEYIDDKNKNGNFIIAEQSNKDEGNVDSRVLSYNSFFPFIELRTDPEECFHKCQYGSMFKFKLVKGLPFANKFKLSGKCEWMTVMINSSQTNELAQISLRHSFAVLPKEVKAFPMDFSNFMKGYEVIVAYYVESRSGINEGENTLHSKMIIANSHGHAIRTKELPGSEREITFSFSDDECLVAPIGAETEDKDDGKWDFTGFEFTDELNLGFRTVAFGESYKSFRYAREKKVDGEKSYDGKDKYIAPNSGTNPGDVVTVTVKPSFETTTTNAPIVYNLTVPEDEPVTPVVISPRDLEIQRVREWMQYIRNENARKAAEVIKYWYWAIPAGFASSSFGTFIIANIILFVFKRTVFTFWYKAMYKRYGSDTTMGAGTTMGKTAGGETIGGSTTVGGGTTMGSTTAGETGSTTAA